MTPCSTASVTTDSTPAPVQGPCGIRLVYAEALGLRDEKAVRDVLIKAERKFNIGYVCFLKDEGKEKQKDTNKANSSSDTAPTGSPGPSIPPPAG